MLYERFSVNTIVCPGHGKDTTLLEIRHKKRKSSNNFKKRITVKGAYLAPFSFNLHLTLDSANLLSYNENST